jgi:hypothetical protein
MEGVKFMSTLRPEGVFFSLICAVAIAVATPSTQIWIPSTDIQKFMNPHIGWDVYLGQAGTGAISNGGITIGVLPFKKLGLEIGVDYRDLSGDHQNPLYLNAKAGIPEDAFFKFMPAVAFGVYDLGFARGVNDYDLLYGLLAKTIWKLGRLSAGGYYAAGDTALMLNKDGEHEPGGFLVSWDRTMSEISDKLWLAVDFQGGTNGYGALSFGAAWMFAPNAGVIIGYDYYLNADALPGTITVQFDLNLFSQ